MEFRHKLRRRKKSAGEISRRENISEQCVCRHAEPVFNIIIRLTADFLFCCREYCVPLGATRPRGFISTVAAFEASCSRELYPVFDCKESDCDDQNRYDHKIYEKRQLQRTHQAVYNAADE